MILYHGGKVTVESPEIRIQKYNKDFYFGFYCTLYPEQAIRWATRFDGISAGKLSGRWRNSKGLRIRSVFTQPARWRP